MATKYQDFRLMKTNEKDTKQVVVPALRFPEFKTLAPWQTDTVDNLVSTITPPCKLNTSEYQKTGEYPIVDQSQDLYCGWTNNQSAVIFQHFPLIIFGDHTCVIKLINRPFAQGADGIKILKSRGLVDPHFLYQCLENKPITQESYKRHFALLRSKIIAYPPKKTREQQKIAECLSSIDALIKAAENKIDELKAHKKGLMQQLFPAEGKSVPALRFPEFQNAGEWTKGPLSRIGEVLQGYGFPEKYQGKSLGKYPFYKVSDISKAVQTGCNFISKAANYIDDEELDILKIKTIPPGTTIFARIGEAIRLNRRIVTTQKCIIDNNTVGIKAIPENAIDLFMYYILLQIDLIDFAGGVVPAVTKSAIENIPIYCPPTKSEQQKIADCLSSVDDLITIQTNRLEALKAHKKGLMQQLFPNIDDREE